jgi:quercetin dioxygenase-like cupin family protein
LQILHNKQLKEHVIKVPAFLICITGKTVFKKERGLKKALMPGAYVNIDPMMKHWVITGEYSNLLITK